MKISYATLAALIAKMSPEQQSDFVTVEIPTEGAAECYAAELRIAGEEHDGGLDDGHPVLFVHLDEEDDEDEDEVDYQPYRDDVDQIASDIGIV